jgi:integrase
MATMRRATGEWIVRTSSNRWQARYRTPDKKVKSKTWDRKSDARRWLREEKHKIDNLAWIDSRSGERRFSDVATSFVESRVDVRPSTLTRDKHYLNSLILPEFGSTPVGQIVPSSVQRWVSHLTEDGKAPETVRKAYHILSMCLNTAKNDRLITTNPCVDIRLPKVEPKEIRLLSMTEIDLLAASIDPRYRAMVYCGALAGLRIGETAALRVDSFDPVDRALTINATLSQLGTGPPTRTPVKTAASRRMVWIPTFLADELELHLIGHSGGEFLIEAPDGGPLRLRNWRRRVWAPAVKDSIGGDLRFHDLRHAHVALLIQQKVQPKEIQVRLGHTSIRTTMDRYGHLFEGSDEAVARQLDTMLAGRDAHSTRTEGFSATDALP